MGCTFLRLASAAFRMQFCCNDASCSGMRYQVIAALNCLILNTVLASIRASRYCKGPWKMRLIIRWLESPFYFLSIPSLPATTIRIRESFLLFFRVSMNCQWKKKRKREKHASNAPGKRMFPNRRNKFLMQFHPYLNNTDKVEMYKYNIQINCILQLTVFVSVDGT